MLAVVLVGSLALLVKPPAAPTGSVKEAIRPLELLPVGDAVGRPDSEREISLRDPVPLYLPTSLNAGQAGALADDGRREPVAAFRNFPAQLNIGDAGPRVGFPGPVQTPAGPVEAIDPYRGREAFRYLGLRPTTMPQAVRRLGFIEVATAESGELVLRAELPPIGSAPSIDWGPVDMVVAVNRSGLAGLPFITQSSGSAQFDAWFPRYLANTYRLGERLQPGNYRISLGP